MDVPIVCELQDIAGQEPGVCPPPSRVRELVLTAENAEAEARFRFASLFDLGFRIAGSVIGGPLVDCVCADFSSDGEPFRSFHCTSLPTSPPLARFFFGPPLALDGGLDAGLDASTDRDAGPDAEVDPIDCNCATNPVACPCTGATVCNRSTGACVTDTAECQPEIGESCASRPDQCMCPEGQICDGVSRSCVPRPPADDPERCQPELGETCLNAPECSCTRGGSNRFCNRMGQCVDPTRSCGDGEVACQSIESGGEICRRRCADTNRRQLCVGGEDVEGCPPLQCAAEEVLCREDVRGSPGALICAPACPTSGRSQCFDGVDTNPVRCAGFNRDGVCRPELGETCLSAPRDCTCAVGTGCTSRVGQSRNAQCLACEAFPPLSTPSGPRAFISCGKTFNRGTTEQFQSSICAVPCNGVRECDDESDEDPVRCLGRGGCRCPPNLVCSPTGGCVPPPCVDCPRCPIGTRCENTCRTAVCVPINTPVER